MQKYVEVILVGCGSGIQELKYPHKKSGDNLPPDSTKNLSWFNEMCLSPKERCLETTIIDGKCIFAGFPFATGEVRYFEGVVSFCDGLCG